MVKKEDQSNDSNLSTSSSSSSNSFINNNNNQVNLISNQAYTLTDHTQIRSMQNLANKLVVAAAAVGNGNPILCTGSNNQADVAQVYFQNPNDLTNTYNLQAAVHLISQAAQQQHHQRNSNGLKELTRESNKEKISKIE